MGLASGPWGVEYRLLALCSAAVVLQIWVKQPAGTVFISGLDSPVLKNSVFTPPADKTLIFCWEQGSPAPCRPDAGETPLGIRIIFSSKLNSTELVKRQERCAGGEALNDLAPCWWLVAAAKMYCVKIYPAIVILKQSGAPHAAEISLLN